MKFLLIGLFASCCACLASIPSSETNATGFTDDNGAVDQADFDLPAPPPISPSQIWVQLPWLPSVHRTVDARVMIRAAAQKHRVPAAFIKSIIAAESNFDAAAISPKGAIGLMQLMPETAQLFGADPTVPEQNVDAGARYLRFLIDRYHRCRDWLKRVIAAYNAGPGAVDHYRGVPPYRETRTYVARVLNFLKQFRREPV